jgi:predicted RND superfamily exporter protein
MRDPLGLGSQTLKHLQDFQLEANYELINEHIFSRDGSTLLMFITPVFNTGSTGKNDKLIRLIENELQKAEKEHPQLVAEYFGGPSVGVYNARQIKKDTLVTSSIALIIIIVFISLVFKHKKSIPLIITPVLFGALFALCLIYKVKAPTLLPLFSRAQQLLLQINLPAKFTDVRREFNKLADELANQAMDRRK